MTKRYSAFSLLEARYNFHVFIFLTLQKFHIKFLFLAVLLNSLCKLCCLSYCMYISLNAFKTTLKQNMKQMEESFMLLALLTMCLSDSLFYKTVLISKCSSCFKYSTYPGDNFELTDLHINSLPFQK